MIYFVRASLTGLVKIGTTTDLKGRIAALETGSGPLETLATRPGGRREEKLLHERHGAAWVFGEWYRLTPEVRKEIGLPAADAEPVSAEVYRLRRDVEDLRRLLTAAQETIRRQRAELRKPKRRGQPKGPLTATVLESALSQRVPRERRRR